MPCKLDPQKFGLDQTLVIVFLFLSFSWTFFFCSFPKLDLSLEKSVPCKLDTQKFGLDQTLQNLLLIKSEDKDEAEEENFYGDGRYNHQPRRRVGRWNCQCQDSTRRKCARRNIPRLFRLWGGRYTICEEEIRRKLTRPIGTGTRRRTWERYGPDIRRSDFSPVISTNRSWAFRTGASQTTILLGHMYIILKSNIPKSLRPIATIPTGLADSANVLL